MHTEDKNQSFPHRVQARCAKDVAGRYVPQRRVQIRKHSGDLRWHIAAEMVGVEIEIKAHFCESPELAGNVAHEAVPLEVEAQRHACETPKLAGDASREYVVREGEVRVYGRESSKLAGNGSREVVAVEQKVRRYGRELPKLAGNGPRYPRVIESDFHQACEETDLAWDESSAVAPSEAQLCHLCAAAREARPFSA
jgi:hypothetical protein